jgi:hypothetical protein
MATDKLFNVFGVSKLDGEYKVRFANDILRSKVLHKHGHEDVRLEDIGRSVTKYEGIKAIQAMDQFSDAAAQSAIAEYLEEKAPKTPAKAKVATTAPKATKAKAAPAKDTKKSRESQALAEARAKAAEMLATAEDAPY